MYTLFFLLIETTGEFTGNARTAFPYLLASKPDQTIFLPECVPDGFTLSDPDHLPASKIETLYLHWIGRQHKGQPPFIVLNASPNHVVLARKGLKSAKAKGKQKIDYVDVNSDDEDNEDREEGEGDDEENDQKLSNEDEEEEEEEEEGEGEGDEEEEEEGEGDGEEEEEIPRGVKFGPPIRRGNPPSTKDLSKVAGSSKLPSAKHLPKKATSKAEEKDNIGKRTGRHVTRNSSNKLSKNAEEVSN